MDNKIEQLRLLDDEHKRQLSFAKRRNGLIKKALELYMACDVDAVFVAFSPSGRLSCFFGEKRVEDVLGRWIALPEQTRRVRIPDLELQLLLDILSRLKDQTQAHIQRDRDILAIQEELAQVKEEIQSLLLEIRRYEQLQEATMTIEEANAAEQTLADMLATVQERKNELTTGDHSRENVHVPHPHPHPIDSEENNRAYVLAQQQQLASCNQGSKDPFPPSSSRKPDEGCSYAVAKQKEPAAGNQDRQEGDESSDSENHFEEGSGALVRKKKLAADNQVQDDATQLLDSEKQNEDTPQTSNFRIGSANPAPITFGVVQAESQPQPHPLVDYDLNIQYTGGIHDMLINQSSPPEGIPLEVVDPNPQAPEGAEVANPDPRTQLQQNGLNFSSLLTAPDVPETLFPFGEPVFPQTPEVFSQPPDQLNVSSFQQHPCSYLQGDALDTPSYPNWNSAGVLQPSEHNNDQNSFGSTSGFVFPTSNLIATNFQPVPILQAPYYFPQQMQQGSSSNAPLSSNPQGPDLRYLLRQSTNFLTIPNSVPGNNNIYSELGASSSRPSERQVNAQPVSEPVVEPNLSLNLQGPFANNYDQAQFEAQASSSSSRKRKAPMTDNAPLRISRSRPESSTNPNNAVPAEARRVSSHRIGSTTDSARPVPPPSRSRSIRNTPASGQPARPVPPQRLLNYQIGSMLNPGYPIPPPLRLLSRFQRPNALNPGYPLPPPSRLLVNYPVGNIALPPNPAPAAEPGPSNYQIGNAAQQNNPIPPPIRMPILTNYQFGNIGYPIDPLLQAALRPPMNYAYHPGYQYMGLPVDPHLRSYQRMLYEYGYFWPPHGHQ